MHVSNPNGRLSFFCTLKSVRSIKVKVKVTPVQTPKLCTGRTAYRGSRDIALPLTAALRGVVNKFPD